MPKEFFVEIYVQVSPLALAISCALQMARKQTSESAMDTTTTPQPLDADLLRQAMLDARISSDVTQHMFGFLPDIQKAYNALLESKQQAVVTGGEEVA